jgi:HEAT repeat protein
MFVKGKKKSKIPADKAGTVPEIITVPPGTPAEKSVEHLIGELRDPDEIVRSTAAGALGYRKSEKSVEPLILALKDRHVYVRHAAAWALGEIKSEKSVEALRAALNDEDETTRGKAAEALRKIQER